MAKGTSRAEVMSNSEKIKPVALDIVLSEGISQSGNQAVGRKFHKSFLNSVATF